MMKPTIATNVFKTNLLKQAPQLGLWLGLASAYSAEICAGAGFDWLMIDAEHAPNDIRTILQQLQAIAAHPVHAVVRPPVNEPWLIKQLLDIGVQTLLIPMVDTAEQARNAVRSVRYPPRGIRGVGSALARASGFNRIPNYLSQADDQICLLVQVETTTALKNINDIASVEGVDGVFIGPSDLSASMGHLGNPAHKDVQAAINHAIDAINTMGKAAGILMTDEALCRAYIAQGCRFAAIATDIGLLSRGMQNSLAAFRDNNDETGAQRSISVY